MTGDGIGVRFDKFWTPVCIGLFLVLLVLQIKYENLNWWVVFAPLYIPPIATLVIALIQLCIHKKYIREWF